MAYSRTFFHEHIVLNDAFKYRTRFDVVQTETAILLAARELSIEDTFDVEMAA